MLDRSTAYWTGPTKSLGYNSNSIIDFRLTVFRVRNGLKVEGYRFCSDAKRSGKGSKSLYSLGLLSLCAILMWL